MSESCQKTGSSPCVVCRTCHYSACPVMFGGNPERPNCEHNAEVTR